MKANRLKLAKELQRTAEAKNKQQLKQKCLKKAKNKSQSVCLNHRATNRTAKLVVKPAAYLTKGKPLGLTFFLCNTTVKQSN